ncbi:phage tail sheath C-terminal domain-containing protein [Alteromonas sp. a30]|uniref:phage tail sheath C-terminal domain-containing protein n=1 Tax=Alteromonas sp. a30 TaxID=2730917 RepID=UPI00227EE051|nr:phage tail sheath C-terminal domain-containing protein [Alteromonas sp. a30]MCY7294217.1 phage tail sheath family protein [Alteromonas sp. a30]
MNDHKTPGVYTKETSTLAPSVAQVSTAVPVFIGYTEKTLERDADGLPQLVPISSMLEYQNTFGGAYLDPNYTVKVKGYSILDIQTPASSYIVTPSLELFFKNGGGVCYVISLGTYDQVPDKGDFEKALLSLEKDDVPSLICLTDAVNLNPDDYHDLVQQALLHCSSMENRFCILDVLNHDADGAELGIDDASAAFRESVGNNNLIHGAAYYPYVRTTISHAFTEDSVRLTGYDDEVAQFTTDPNGVAFFFSGDEGKGAKVSVVTSGTAESTSITVNDAELVVTLAKDTDSISSVALFKVWNALGKSARGKFSMALQGTSEALVTPFAPTALSYHEGRYVQNMNGLGVFYYGPESNKPAVSIEVDQTETGFEITPQADPGQNSELHISVAADATLEDVIAAWQGIADTQLFDIKALGTGAASSILALSKTELDFATSDVKLRDIKFDKGALYNDILAELKLQRMVLPPSSAIAGIYAANDSTFGVWKAPANVGVASVIEPVRRLNNREQENLNVDVNAGKSINVIRTFTGKGTLVWGARTLAGNDNEWRYINVRRLFNMVKASLQKATGFAVFQPNTPITWLKVRALMESYLEDLWQAGGLVGDTKEQAFFVRIGQGVTMNEDDILNGRMKIDVGLRASRPAEFIIINFTHHVLDN